MTTDPRDLLAETVEVAVRKLTHPIRRFIVLLAAIGIAVVLGGSWFGLEQHNEQVQGCMSSNSRAQVDQKTWDEFLGLLITHSTDVTPGDKQVVAEFEHQLAVVDAPRNCNTGWF